MKKFALAFAFLCLSTSALANKSVRIINDDATQEMTVQTQNCVDKTKIIDGSRETTCQPTQTYVLKNHITGQHFQDIAVADDTSDKDYLYSNYLNVINAKSSSGAVANFVANKYCTASGPNDAILLNSHYTNLILCNSHSHSGTV